MQHCLFRDLFYNCLQLCQTKTIQQKSSLSLRRSFWSVCCWSLFSVLGFVVRFCNLRMVHSTFNSLEFRRYKWCLLPAKGSRTSPFNGKSSNSLWLLYIVHFPLFIIPDQLPNLSFQSCLQLTVSITLLMQSSHLKS